MIKNTLKRFFRNQKQNEAIILLYHRVFTPITDVWDLSVSPDHFAQHLNILKNKYQVISLPELIIHHHKNTIKKKSVVITFDDGYSDNFSVAKPLLEDYQLPATFFICTDNIDTNRQFWWDELESIFLQSSYLPQKLPEKLSNFLSQSIDDLEHILKDTLLRNHRKWRPFISDPPSQRAKAYLIVWEKLKNLKKSEQEEWLHVIRDWAGFHENNEHANYSMSLTQLQSLKGNPYIQVGAHTVTHPALSEHDVEFQEHEVSASKNWLETQLAISIKSIAFPYGNYNDETLKVVEKLGFSASLTTENKLIKENSSPYTLGRWVIQDWSGDRFEEFLQNVFQKT